MSQDQYGHMPWCPDPDHPYSCSLEQQLTDDVVIMLTAGQCDLGSVHLEVQGAVHSTTELAALIEALQQLAAPLAVAEAETNCIGHNHDDDPEDDDEADGVDEGLLCNGCDTLGHNNTWDIEGIGQVAQDCGCLQAAGYRLVDRFRLERI